jgi:hypothetical protein
MLVIQIKDYTIICVFFKALHLYLIRKKPIANYMYSFNINKNPMLREPFKIIMSSNI